MALKVLQSGLHPLGYYDALDAQTTTMKGGEVVTFGTVAVGAATDKSAADSADGYLYTGANRPVVTNTIGASTRPYMLSDDGTSGYGTLFGQVVGGTVGQVVTGGAVLGPHTATASGKITCWHQPGLFGVTLDAVHTDATVGLSVTNSTLTTGAALYSTSAGLLTPDSTARVSTYVAARFVSFETDRSLVTTPNRLVAALNSPSGGSALSPVISYAVIHFNPGQ